MTFLKRIERPALFADAIRNRNMRGFSVFNVVVLWESKARRRPG